MLLQRLHDPKLAQASYLIGCASAREAIVIDPTRDAEQYLAAAAGLGLRIRHVTETHIHADFVSGSRELVERTGAALYLSDEGGDDWRYDYGPAAGATLLHEGDEISVGSVRLRALHTPGHTPEHLTFLVTDGASATEPIAAVTGDFVFVGDVGRPDLLERAARVAGTMEAAARQLFRSLQRFAALPDYLQIWPGHGAGSACGKALGAVPQSTLGYERRFNWAFAVRDEDEFVRAVLAGQPDPPRYFAEMKRINRDGPRVLGAIALPPRLDVDGLASALASGATVVDTRPARDFVARAVPGTINIPAGRAFTGWAGWLLPYDRDFYLLAHGGPASGAEDQVRDLAGIGLDRVAGYAVTDVIDAWGASGRRLLAIPGIEARELAGALLADAVAVIDVRGRSEWLAGHLPGAVNVPLGELEHRLDTLPRGRPLVVHCHTGARAAIAASVLHARGRADVRLYGGGYAEWSAAGHPTEKAPT